MLTHEAPGLIMKIYTNDQELIDLGVTYLRIVGLIM